MALISGDHPMRVSSVPFDSAGLCKEIEISLAGRSVIQLINEIIILNNFFIGTL